MAPAPAPCQAARDGPRCGTSSVTVTMFRTPAPSCPRPDHHFGCRAASRVRAGGRRTPDRRNAAWTGLVAILLAVPALGGACVFVPPPPLPEEIAAAEASKAARKAAVRAGIPAASPEGAATG